MLVFIVPVKSPKVSSSWDFVCRLLERTARSICNQTSDQFRVVVVCNQKPAIDFSHPFLHYLEVDLPLPSEQYAASGLDESYDFRPPDVIGKNLDKSNKIKAGVEYAQQFSPTHLMVVDADDCISKHIAEYVAAQPTAPGWYIEKGYLYHKNRKFLQHRRKELYRICGSSLIVAANLFEKLFVDDLIYEHRFYRCSYQFNFSPLPFAGTIYEVAHGENNFQTVERQNERYRKYGFLLIIKNFFRSSRISQKIKDDFCFYVVD